MTKISMIVALSSNRVISTYGKMPWAIPEDIKYFKDMTLGKPVIMGAKTFTSTGCGIFLGRKNIIMTRCVGAKINMNEDYTDTSCHVATNVAEALKAAGDVDEIMVIGGELIYNLFLPIATKLYITDIHKIYLGDRYFPQLNTSEWVETSRRDVLEVGSVPSHSYLELSRKVKDTDD